MGARLTMMALFVWFIIAALVVGSVEGARIVDAKEQLERRLTALGGTSHRARREASRRTARDLMEAGPETELKVQDVSRTAQGGKIWKMQEVYRGKEVYDTQMTIETDDSGQEIVDATGIVVQDIHKDTDGIPEIYSNDAVKNVLEEFGDSLEQARDVKVDIKVFVDNSQQAFAGYQVEYKVEEDGKPRRPTALVDGRDGKVILSWNAMTTFCSEDQGMGIGGNERMGELAYNGVHYDCLDVTKVGDVCYLENERVAVVDMGGETWHNMTSIFSYDCFNATDGINGAYSPALDAFHNGNAAVRMFEEWYNVSLLTEGMKVVLRVHYGEGYPTAFWNGANATFGDGRGTFLPFVSPGLIGHELGHAVVEQGSGLIWFNQPGAINEAFADITGEVLEHYVKGSHDWLVGHDISRYRAVRFFENPEDNYIAISNMTDYIDYMDPHQSGGILAHAFYLIVEEFNQTMKDAYGVFLYANRMYWHHLSSVKSSVCDMMKSAYDLGQPGEPYKMAFERVGVEVCNISEHVVGLHNNVTKTGIMVSNSTRPVYIFGIPTEWIKAVHVTASSAHGPVLITITDQTWMKAYAPEDENIIAQDYDHATFDVTDENLYYVTITLSSDHAELWSDVSIRASLLCVDAAGGLDYYRRAHCEGASY